MRMLKCEKKFKKILFFKIGAIGDVLMTTPLVRAVQKEFPDAKINYWVGEFASSALHGNKRLSRVVTFDADMFFKKKPVNLLYLLRRIRREKYDLAFVLDKSWSVNIFVASTGIPVRIGFDRRGEGFANTQNVQYNNDEHEIVQYLKLVELLTGKKEKQVLPELFLSKADVKFAHDFFRKHGLKSEKIIVFAPGGGKNAGEKECIRAWPREKYAELVKHLVKRFTVVLVGGPDDSELTKWIRLRVPSDRVIDVAGKTSVAQTGAIMKRAKWVVCNDAGPMHVASAVGARIVSLFGPTNPKRKAPLNKGCVALWTDKESYDPEYEWRGKMIKNKEFFSELDVNSVARVVK